MKKNIWVVISGVDYQDCQDIEGCFESLESAQSLVEELKIKIGGAGKWENNCIFYPATQELRIQHNSWSCGDKYLKIQEHDLLS